MATVQLIDANGQDRSDTLRFYVRRMSLATCTHPIHFVGGQATVSPEDFSALQALGVVRVLA